MLIPWRVFSNNTSGFCKKKQAFSRMSTIHPREPVDLLQQGPNGAFFEEWHIWGKQAINPHDLLYASNLETTLVIHEAVAKNPPGFWISLSARKLWRLEECQAVISPWTPHVFRRWSVETMPDCWPARWAHRSRRSTLDDHSGDHSSRRGWKYGSLQCLFLFLNRVM